MKRGWLRRNVTRLAAQFNMDAPQRCTQRSTRSTFGPLHKTTRGANPKSQPPTSATSVLMDFGGSWSWGPMIPPNSSCQS